MLKENLTLWKSPSSFRKEKHQGMGNSGAQKKGTCHQTGRSKGSEWAEGGTVFTGCEFAHLWNGDKNSTYLIGLVYGLIRKALKTVLTTISTSSKMSHGHGERWEGQCTEGTLKQDLDVSLRLEHAKMEGMMAFTLLFWLHCYPYTCALSFLMKLKLFKRTGLSSHLCCFLHSDPVPHGLPEIWISENGKVHPCAGVRFWFSQPALNFYSITHYVELESFLIQSEDWTICSQRCAKKFSPLVENLSIPHNTLFLLMSVDDQDNSMFLAKQSFL